MKKNTHVVVNFCAQKLSVCSITKSLFQSCQELVQMKWGQEYEGTLLSRFWNRMNFWSGLATKKSIHVAVKLCAQKCRYAVLQNCFINLVEELFKWNEGYCRSVRSIVGTETEVFFDLGCLWKKILMSLSIFALKNCRYAVSQKVFFNLVMNLFKWNDG